VPYISYFHFLQLCPVTLVYLIMVKNILLMTSIAMLGLASSAFAEKGKKGKKMSPAHGKKGGKKGKKGEDDNSL